LAASPPHAKYRPLNAILGVAHVAGDYHFTEGDFLNEGADQLLKLGTKVIKVWFVKDMKRSYPFGPPFPEVHSLVELAKTEPMRLLFKKPFKTYILETYAFGRSDHYWQNGIAPEQEADERRQFRDLAAYLLKTYKGTSKTFVLQHWEGDWAIRPTTDAKLIPTPMAIQGMIRWLNARQDGVEEARKAFFGTRYPKPGQRGVDVYHASEVNLILPAMEGQASVTKDVLPSTHCDLYSYSAYETSIKGDRFLEAMAYLAKQAPDSPMFGAKNLYLGEFGVPEREFGTDFALKSLQRTINEGKRLGLRYMIYWEVYDNECKEQPATQEEQCRGFWLIKPNGAHSALYNLFAAALHSASAPQHP
jgi:hypothetical protein